MNRKLISEFYPDLLVADGFDEAIIGVARTFNNLSVAYDTKKCLEILMTRDKMTRDDAQEYFDFNIVRSYVGENTPTFIEL
jgi:hypothetical protein